MIVLFMCGVYIYIYIYIYAHTHTHSIQRFGVFVAYGQFPKESSGQMGPGSFPVARAEDTKNKITEHKGSKLIKLNDI